VTRRWSLRTRFVLAALACLLPLIGVTLYILYQSLEHSSDQLVDAEEAVAGVVASGLNETLRENETVLQNVAAMDDVRTLNDKGTESVFAGVREVRPNLAGLFLVDQNGAFLVTPPLDPEPIRADYDAVLNRTLTLGVTGVSGPLSIGDEEVIAIFVPVWPEGADIGASDSSADSSSTAGASTQGATAAAIGAVGALISLDRIERIFTPFANEETEISVVASGQVIASSTTTEGDSLTVRLAEPIEKALQGATGTHSYEDVSGDERLAVYTPVEFEAAEWAVIVSAPSPRNYGPNQSLLQQSVAALVLAVFVTLILAFAFGDVTARPLRQLTTQASSLAEGDFTQRIAPTGGGEVRTLSVAFREMEDRLAAQVRALEDARRERERQAEELRDLNRRTVRLQEEERRRIAADIHDAVSPLITGALYQNRALRISNGHTDPVERDAGLDAVSNLLERAGEELHGVIFALRPPDLDDIGVVAAIERYMAGIQRHGLTTRLEVLGEPPGLTPEARLAVYRIVQEALHNVVRHAGADEAVVRIESTPDLLRVVVRDNGSGFDLERAQGPTSLGILSMRERAAAIGATVEIASRPGGGTVVVIERPTTGAVRSAAESETERGAAAERDDAERVSLVVDEGEAASPGAPRRTQRRGRNGRSSRAVANGVHHRPSADGKSGETEVGEVALPEPESREGAQP
jgi:signal transduction histidine kinase